MNTQNNDQNNDLMSSWVRGIYVLGWSLAAVSGAVTAAKDGVWYGWGLLFFSLMQVFISAGWQQGMFRPIFRYHEPLLLIIGLGKKASPSWIWIPWPGYPQTRRSDPPLRKPGKPSKTSLKPIY